MQTGTDVLAPGHPYVATLGTGIDWTATQVTRYESGEAVARVPYPSATAWDFWHGLHFARAFPEVTHWWFRSLWTGAVQIALPHLLDDGSVSGWMTFGDEPETPRLYTMDRDEGRIRISVPLPPHAEHLANLPLRLILAQQLLATCDGAIAPATSHMVTSLVGCDALARVFPPNRRAQDRLWGPWDLSHGAGSLEGPLRDDLCVLLGLDRP